MAMERENSHICPVTNLWVTRYGARIYFLIHYFLADNTVEINEAHCRNSGRDSYPVHASESAMPSEDVVVAGVFWSLTIGHFWVYVTEWQIRWSFARIPARII